MFFSYGITWIILKISDNSYWRVNLFGVISSKITKTFLNSHILQHLLRLLLIVVLFSINIFAVGLPAMLWIYLSCLSDMHEYNLNTLSYNMLHCILLMWINGYANKIMVKKAWWQYPDIWRWLLLKASYLIKRRHCLFVVGLVLFTSWATSTTTTNIIFLCFTIGIFWRIIVNRIIVGNGFVLCCVSMWEY